MAGCRHQKYLLTKLRGCKLCAQLDVLDTPPEPRFDPIPQDMFDRVLERFVQNKGVKTQRKGGGDLGLSISKAIVETFGGKIGVECPAEGGSLFYIELIRLLGKFTPHCLSALYIDPHQAVPITLKLLMNGPAKRGSLTIAV